MEKLQFYFYTRRCDLIYYTLISDKIKFQKKGCKFSMVYEKNVTLRALYNLNQNNEHTKLTFIQSSNASNGSKSFT